MAIVNRDLDPSQQREMYVANLVGTASAASAGIFSPVLVTGNTFPLALITSQSQLVSGGVAAWGLSGSPVLSFWLYRFAGGFTSIAIGQTLAVTAFGTSGALGISVLPAATTYQLQAGDQIVAHLLGSNSALDKATVTLVCRNLQDIVTDFSV